MFGKERVLVVVLVALAVGTLVSALSTSIGADARRPRAPGHRRRRLPARRSASCATSSRAARVATGHRADLGDCSRVGGGFGIVLAGPIVDHFDYHYLFWIPLVPS